MRAVEQSCTEYLKKKDHELNEAFQAFIWPFDRANSLEPIRYFFSTCRRAKPSSKVKMWFESLRIYPQNAVYPNLAITVAAC